MSWRGESWWLSWSSLFVGGYRRLAAIMLRKEKTNEDKQLNHFPHFFFIYSISFSLPLLFLYSIKHNSSQCLWLWVMGRRPVFLCLIDFDSLINKEKTRKETFIDSLAGWKRESERMKQRERVSWVEDGLKTYNQQTTQYKLMESIWWSGRHPQITHSPFASFKTKDKSFLFSFPQTKSEVICLGGMKIYYNSN